MIQRELAANGAGINRNAYSDANRDDITLPIVFVSGPVSFEIQNFYASNSFLFQNGGILIDLIANSTQVVAIVASGGKFNTATIYY